PSRLLAGEEALEEWIEEGEAGLSPRESAGVNFLERGVTMTNDISSSLLARYRSGNLNPDRPEGGDNGGGEGPTLPQVSSATLLLDLEADTLLLSEGDPVSLWEDQSGNGNDF